MKTVISASRRTDIPAYYLNWFSDRIKQGFVDVANPLFRQNIRRVDLSPEKVGWIVFWSRNYNTFLKRRSEFDNYQLFFHFTILSSSILEKRPFPATKAIDQAEAIAKIYGGERIAWRYDPIVFWEEKNLIKNNFDRKDFELLCKDLSVLGVKRCFTSIAHKYRKFNQRFKMKFPDIKTPDHNQTREQAVISEMIQISRAYNISLYVCCTDHLLNIKGISAASCINGQLLQKIYPAEKISMARRPTRGECRCTKSIDIGDYISQPCPTGCIYCYANPIWK